VKSNYMHRCVCGNVYMV